MESVDAKKLRLLEVDTSGDWRRRASTFHPDDVTRIGFGGGYEESLHLVAGPPPPA